MQLKNLIIILFLNSFSISAQNWNWVSTIEGAASDYLWDVVHDSNNNIIVTGRVKGDATFGNGLSSVFIPETGLETDIFLAKFNNNGELLWANRMGDVDPDWGRALAVDLNDNIYLTGDFANMAIFGTDTIYGYDNGLTAPSSMARSGFVAKYQPDGTLTWVEKFQGGDRCRGYGICVDSSGYLYLTGTISGLTDFGGVIAGEANALIYGFVAKYNPSGGCVWANYFDSPFGSQGNDIAVLDDSRIMVTGNYKSQLIYDGQTIVGSSPTWPDYFLMQIDSSGDYTWSVKGIGSYFIQGYNMAISNQNEIYVVGHFSATMNLGDTSLVSAGIGSTTADINAHADSFIAKYDENGNRLWIRQLGSQYRTEITGVAILDEKYLVVSGYTQDTIPLYNGIDSILPVTGYDTGILACFDSGGAYQWSKIATPAGAPVAASYNAIIGNTIFCVDVDNYNNIIAGGLFGDEAFWDTTYHDAYSIGHDGFVGKLFPPLEAELAFNPFCVGDTVLFVGSAFGSPIFFDWDLLLNSIYVSSDDSMYALINDYGYDSVSFLVTNGYETDTVFFAFEVDAPPSVDLGVDYSTCLIQDTLIAVSNGVYYDWGVGSNPFDSTKVIVTSGTYQVVVSDSLGCTNTDFITVQLDACAGVDGYLSDYFSLYPNPTSGLCLLKGDLNAMTDCTLYIWSMSGQLVYQNKITSLSLDLSSLNPGIYKTEIMGESGFYKTLTFVKL